MKNGNLKNCGPVKFGGSGRPSDVYAGLDVPVKANQMAHDVICSKFALPYFLAGCECRREGPVNRADAEITLGPLTLHVEIDMNTEGIGQVVERLEGYRGLADEHFVLFVAPHERRVKRVADASRHLGALLLFTTFEQTRKEPFGQIWRSASGRHAPPFSSLLASLTAPQGHVLGGTLTRALSRLRAE